MMHISEALQQALTDFLIESYIDGVEEAGAALDALVGGEFPASALVDVMAHADPADADELRATVLRVLHGGPLYV